ncbi:hypothetical protein TCAL_03624 [Tigriopus californicus]|uniref:Uncharacterized protein n=1 Tax=Tigriopus californicus TaxID=6832 RepID=A0A553NBQ3_TIGCA|nr:E3 ubiquitin-protein ligase mind-bomb-like [Tigriopus californicus]TRY62845.1 hypothetical protein TCAL_03624 [Tigriopus californicus]|eukprot:TCALIF_03624-PA protein Name:"Similar to ANK3 Ankyrin-3 (Homo sapiens)" AED:0.17 eAED:0.17 QI:0/-1/0/1/-1/1/1/0/557
MAEDEDMPPAAEAEGHPPPALNTPTIIKVADARPATPAPVSLVVTPQPTDTHTVSSVQTCPTVASQPLKTICAENDSRGQVGQLPGDATSPPELDPGGPKKAAPSDHVPLLAEDSPICGGSSATTRTLISSSLSTIATTPSEEDEEAADVEEADVEESNAYAPRTSQVPESVKNDVDKWLQYLDESDPCHRLRSLCKKGDVAAVRKLLSSGEPGLDINAVSDEGWTCLHEIITHECQFTEVARVLLDFGASVNTQDLHGDSPLHSALLYHNVENIGLLVDHGSDLTLLNAGGRTPVHVADESETLKLLLDKGAKVDTQDRLGNTPLHYAVVSRDRERVSLMITQYEPSINLQNQAGSSALHLTNDTDIAQMLLMAGADPNVPDLNLNTPLHVAVRGRHKEIVKMMLEKSADITLTNAAGKTPVNMSKDREMKNILLGKISATPNQLAGPPCATNQKKPIPVASEKGGAKSSVSDSVDKCAQQVVVNPVVVCITRSILKRRRFDVNDEAASDPPASKGPRLRFSEVNDYSGVEVIQEQKRVRVPPIYSEPKFSSDDEF